MKQLKAEAFSLGARLAALGYRIMYGGGTEGLSKALVKGIISHDLSSVTAVVQKHEIEPIRLMGINCHEVGSVSERKDFILNKAHKIFILPGGLGTLDEAAYAIMCKKTGYYSGDIFLLDFLGYWAFLDDVLKKMASHKFIDRNDGSLYVRIQSVESLIEAIS
jgi:uncharacterized protein (TIGR00730 family)